MILGSHNSWSYLPPAKWWLRPFAFMAKCQDKNITEQYALGVRCFDLRITFSSNGTLYVAHGFLQYRITRIELMAQLQWLNSMCDCYMRVIHEVRKSSNYTAESRRLFSQNCKQLEYAFPNITFWCGRNLYNWNVDYQFRQPDPSCLEMYSSVCLPRLIDDWWPRLYAKIHNRQNIKTGTDKDILLIDFVNIN